MLCGCLAGWLAGWLSSINSIKIINFKNDLYQQFGFSFVHLLLVVVVVIVVSFLIEANR